MLRVRTLLVDPPLLAGDVIVRGDEARHGRTVLRLRPGQQLRLADGAGRAGSATVLSVGKELQCRCQEVVELSSQPAERLHVALAPPKGGRWDDCLRALTELGVGGIAPLACERGERLPRQDRAERIVREALKQCQRPRLPQLSGLTDIPALCAGQRRPIVCDPDGDDMPPEAAQASVLVIGPEGGFSDSERQYVRQQGIRRLRLGRSILRIETAAIAAAAIVIHAWELHERHR